jgi:Clostripain family
LPPAIGTDWQGIGHEAGNDAMSATKPKWAVLVYMGADDPDDKNLALAAFRDIKEMQDVGSSMAVRVGVQIDLHLFSPVRFVVAPDGTMQDIERRRESSAGQPSTLTSFLKWAVEKFDADRYLLVLWGHGVGVGFQLEEPATLADVVFDADDGLEVRELAKVLRGFKKRHGRALDLVGFDACYMSGIEVGYELRGLAECLVGAQSSMPFEGWPYTPILRKLKANPRQSARALAKAITGAVVTSFGRRTNVTQTALAPLPAADGVAGSFQKLVTALRAVPRHGRDGRAIRRALKTTSFLEARQFVDLIDLCKRVHAGTRDPSVRRAATEVIKAVKSGSAPLIISHRRRGGRARRLNGLSIYLKSVRASRKDEENVDARIGQYRELEFVKATGWQTFVDTLSRAAIGNA